MLPTHLKLRLDQGNEGSLGLQDPFHRRVQKGLRDEGNVHHHKIHLPEEPLVQGACVDVFQRHDLRPFPKGGMKLIRARIHRIDPPRPSGKEHVGKSSRGRTDVRAIQPLGIDPPSVQRGLQLQSPAGDVAGQGGIPHLDPSPLLHGKGRLFCHGAVHRHAPLPHKPCGQGAAGGKPLLSQIQIQSWQGVPFPFRCVPRTDPPDPKDVPCPRGAKIGPPPPKRQWAESAPDS